MKKGKNLRKMQKNKKGIDEKHKHARYTLEK